MAKSKKETKPKYDPEFYDEDGFPKLPDFLNRKLIREKNEQDLKKSKKKEDKQHRS